MVVPEGPYRAEPTRAARRRAEGVVTGGDVLRALHEPRGARAAGARSRRRPPRCASASREIERLQQILPAIQAVAAAYDGVYLVGGAVRDVLLGEQSLDLDLMVEGDAIAFARELAARARRALPSAREVPDRGREGHRRATAARSASTSRRARTEFYGAPGALPEVERSTLRHDLARRDFTINAMATSLRADDLGATYDFFGGFRDLRQQTVRVLHNLSFVEDPTRLLRAIRYEARLGFRMDGHTLSLARGCIEMRLVGDLVLGAPARRAARPARRGAACVRALARMAELASTARCTRASTPAPRPCALIERADEAMQRAPFAGAQRTPLVRLACLCAGCRRDEVYDWLDRLQLRRARPGRGGGRRDARAAIAERLSSATPRRRPRSCTSCSTDQPLEVLVMAIVRAPRPALRRAARARLPGAGARRAARDHRRRPAARRACRSRRRSARR